ncbi:hypothetical protein roselon_00490 [Roseibacterium elongatum DSM 19469]|uniref:Uncharacterized protein n=1 Tax=Roseicyclus elongatus DSM 19469 TaxID=1294273 RepID=W8S2I6_9RHOB|nr:hypothetical protein [Roseibacterium elongatum]AHM02931.1 hypothetical protein roselon_00490 [Roseibacterium elongatum DSM 19469]
MIWSDETHSYQATMCPRIGKACPEAACLVAQLARSVAEARAFTQPDFEVAGFGRLEGCSDTCSARFIATHARVRLFCGVEADSAMAPLDALADAMFGAAGHGGPVSAAALPQRPLALLEARPTA